MFQFVVLIIMFSSVLDVWLVRILYLDDLALWCGILFYQSYSSITIGPIYTSELSPALIHVRMASLGY